MTPDASSSVTRPLGASFADWLGKDHDIGGGLGYGDLQVTGALGLLIVVLVRHAHRSRTPDALPCAVKVQDAR